MKYVYVYLTSLYACFPTISTCLNSFRIFRSWVHAVPFPDHPTFVHFQKVSNVFSHQAARKLFWGHAIRSTTWASFHREDPVVAACLRCLPNLLVWLMKCWATWIKILLLDHDHDLKDVSFMDIGLMRIGYVRTSNMIISFHGSESNRTFTQHLTLTRWASDDEARSIGIHQCTGTSLWSQQKHWLHKLKTVCRFLSEKTSSRLTSTKPWHLIIYKL